MKLNGKKIAYFIEDLFEDLEFWYPYLRMKEEGAESTIVAPKVKEYSGKHGLTVDAQIGILGVNPLNFDALIIPGGYSPDRMSRVPQMVEFVTKMNDENKIIAAISHGGLVLLSADVVKDKNVTSFFSIKADMENAGGIWQDHDVVCDKNLITSRSPEDLPAFCRKIIEVLSSR